MSELFYNAVPNATRVAPPLPEPRQYPSEKPQRVYLFGTCVVDLFYPEAGMDAIHLLEREGIDPQRYDALVMDTQGSELLVLRGAEPLGFGHAVTRAAEGAGDK